MITQAELMALALQLKEMGASIQVNPEDLQSYYPDVDEKSFYLPTNLPKTFYLGDTKMLRKLNTPNANVFRRLHGIS